jgi:hypothetical protein
MQSDEETQPKRRLLTFRLDRDLGHRLKGRLGADGRTLSDVVVQGLRHYVEHNEVEPDEPAAGEPGTNGTSGAAPDTPRINGAGHGTARHGTTNGSSPPTTANAPGAPDPPGTTDPLGPADPPSPPDPPGAADPPGSPGTPNPRTPGISSAPASPGLPASTDTPAAPDLPVPGATTGTEHTPAGTEHGPTGSESLRLPGNVAAHLRKLRTDGQSDLLSATLAALHEAGWPLRPLGEALGISRQAVQARTRRQVSAEILALVAPCAPPPPYPRRRPGARGAPRRPFTVKVDPELRSAARTKAGQEGMSLTQIVHRILDRYLRHGSPAEPREILLGDTTPTRPSRRGPA